MHYQNSWLVQYEFIHFHYVNSAYAARDVFSKCQLGVQDDLPPLIRNLGFGEWLGKDIGSDKLAVRTVHLDIVSL